MNGFKVGDRVIANDGITTGWINGIVHSIRSDLNHCIGVTDDFRFSMFKPSDVKYVKRITWSGKEVLR